MSVYRWCCKDDDDDDDITNNSTLNNDVIEFYFLYPTIIFHNPAAHWKMSNKNFLQYHLNNLIGTSLGMRRRFEIMPKYFCIPRFFCYLATSCWFYCHNFKELLQDYCLLMVYDGHHFIFESSITMFIILI